MTTDRAAAEVAAPFHGAKLALLMDGAVLTLQRDDIPTIPFPGCWDLPGGGCEGAESPVACALRELHEEFGLTLPAARLTWARRFPMGEVPGESAWFFAGALTRCDIAAIRFGNEGQGWRMMPVAEFIGHPHAVPHLADRLRICLADGWASYR